MMLSCPIATAGKKKKREGCHHPLLMGGKKGTKPDDPRTFTCASGDGSGDNALRLNPEGKQAA